jgi:hypothetical protein
MNIVNFPPREDELPKHAGGRLKSQLDESTILTLEHGTYTVFFDTGDSIIILSNAAGAGEVLLNLEKGKLALLAEVLESER